MLALEITADGSDDVQVRIEYDYDSDNNLMATREYDLAGALSTETLFTYTDAPASVTNLTTLLSHPLSDPLNHVIDTSTTVVTPVETPTE